MNLEYEPSSFFSQAAGRIPLLRNLSSVKSKIAPNYTFRVVEPDGVPPSPRVQGSGLRDFQDGKNLPFATFSVEL